MKPEKNFAQKRNCTTKEFAASKSLTKKNKHQESML